jgi:hypothetical protein
MRLGASEVSQKRQRIPGCVQRKQKQIRLLGLFQPIEQGLLFRKQTEGILGPKGQPEIIEYSKIRLQN